MMRPALLMAALGLVALAEQAPAQAPAQAPSSAVVGTTVTVTATVEAIDMASREVVLKREDGTTATVIAGPEVRNLAQVKVGDRVVIEHSEAIAAEIVKPGDTLPPVSGTSVAGRAEPGGRPGAVAGEAVRVRVQIDQVDREAGTVTFTGPRGATRTVTVKTPQMRDFVRNLSPGEQVDVTFIEAIAVRVEPAR